MPAIDIAHPGTPSPGLRHYYPLPRSARGQDTKVDVCIYGGTPGGVAGAVQASRMGKSAVLAVFRRHVGGLTSAGLTAVDLGKKDSIGGMAAEFLGRVGMWSGFRAADAERTYRTMLAEAGVPVLFEYRLKAVEKDGARIRALVFENGTRIEAKIFIDATYEGDLFAMAGVSYHVGREDNSVYDETFNGFQIAKTHQFRFRVDPYRVPGQPQSGLLPGIVAELPPPAGTGDKRVQAYNFRMWLVSVSEGSPFPKPQGYDRDDFALLERYLTTQPDFPWDFTYKFGPIKINHGDCNNAGPISSDFVGASNAWPEAGYCRARENLPVARDLPAGHDVVPGQRPRGPRPLPGSRPQVCLTQGSVRRDRRMAS